MKLDRYYYITSLPSLGVLGSKPPIDFAELREYLADVPSQRQLVDCLLLLDDLLQREAYLAKERQEVAPSVLTEKQVRGESPLPEFLLPTTSQEPDETLPAQSSSSRHSAPVDTPKKRCPADILWEAYFRHVLRVAQQSRCSFLTDWVHHEVALRNAMVSSRAKRLGLDETDYLVLADLANVDEALTPLVSDWENAPTPLAGYRALIRVRWDWLAENDRHFTFHNDELAAYALRLMLLEQWHRVMGE